MADLTSMLQASAGAGGAESDDDFASTVLLLHGDGTNGAQNNTFLDSSTNNFTITRNGNTTQGSFSPFSKPDGAWGNYFDQSGDYLNFSNSAFAFSTGDFTFEAWVYPIARLSSNNCIFSNYSSYGANSLALFAGHGAGTTTKYQVAVGGSGFPNIQSSSNIIYNAWSHISVVRSSGTITLYVNGVSEGTTTSTANLSGNNGGWIGVSGDQLSGSEFFGYISNARAVIGTAVYTSGFTPSTTPLTAIANTSLLTCQSNRFKDNSTNNFAITAAGNVKVTPFSPFPLTTEYSPSVNGGSGYFDGSGDYLDPPSDAALGMGTGDFTIHFWVYLNSGIPFLIDFRPTSTQGLYPTIYCASSNGLRFYTNSADRITSTVPLIGRWTHIALVRSSGSTKLYANGSQVGSTYADTNNYATARPRIGAGGYTAGDYLNGYISSVAIVKGTAVWTTDFTPPTSPPTAIANTSLLCNFTNAGIFDNTGFNVLETVGNAQIDTTTKKYGTGAMEFDGSGDYCVGLANDNLAFNTGDLTIEFWAYKSTNGSAGYDGVVSYQALASTFSWLVELSSSRGFRIVAKIGGTNYTIANNTTTGINDSTWHHWAICRSSGTWYLFKDGVALTKDIDTIGSQSIATSTHVYVGAEYDGGYYYFNGYIDDLRITKGVARYTTTFTPPTKAFPDVGS